MTNREPSGKISQTVAGYFLLSDHLASTDSPTENVLVGDFDPAMDDVVAVVVEHVGGPLLPPPSAAPDVGRRRGESASNH